VGSNSRKIGVLGNDKPAHWTEAKAKRRGEKADRRGKSEAVGGRQSRKTNSHRIGARFSSLEFKKAALSADKKVKRRILENDHFGDVQ
jgi:hypothetical protein